MRRCIARALAIGILLFPGTVLLLAQKSDTHAVAGPTEAPGLEVRTSLSRTAMWVGDRVVYTIELTCAPGVNVLLDDLAAERLDVDGGEVAIVEADEERRGGRVVRRFRYTLTTYRVDVAALRVAPLTVRYHRRGSVSEAPAGQVVLPSVSVAVRSTLAPGTPSVRHPTALRQPPAYARFAGPVGWSLVAIALLPVAIGAFGLAAPLRNAWTRRAARAGRARAAQAALAELHSIDVTSPGAGVRAYERLDAAVRNYLHAAAGIPAHALTAREIRAALERSAPALPHDTIATLLAACETARYAPEPPSPDDWPRALRDADEILGAPRP